MRKYISLNDGWMFEKKGEKTAVNLPHTWNNLDGQGAEPTYYRGKCTYTKIIEAQKGKTWLEFKGVNAACTVYINGNLVGSHLGGYSAFRFEVTEFLSSPKNFLTVEVDNSPLREVYPETADFTFYGGIYRDVNLITEVEKQHFSLDDCGSAALYITPKMNGDVFVRSVISGYETGVRVLYEIFDAEGKNVASAGNKVRLHVENPHLWNGMEDPYLYTLRATLFMESRKVDCVESRFGFREVRFDADKGCFLNGKHIKLKGVSRHQDREKLGNALTINEHREDLELIREVGANSIRLAHYQQAEEFYSLCDEMGFLVWAEVPVISRFSKKKQANALSQLEELIKQNMNHPSIFCWGIENEITIQGASPALNESIEELNNLAHALDVSRPTTCAQLTMCPVESSLNNITDIMGYNHYYGWYMKTVDGIDEWLEKFRAAQPDVPLCLSEYGAEAVIGYYSDNPVQGDYSEGYQSRFHEHYIKTINSHDWLWGSYVWNMFDFGSSMRNEGGVRGRNNKGLVTFDRKIKKDAFYMYKAFWSDEKFVHIEGGRYTQRMIGKRTFRVISNCAEVTLKCGRYKKTLEGEHVFNFEDVPVKEGSNKVTVTADGQEETVVFEGVEGYPASYSLPDGASTMVRNWFVPKSEGINPEYLSTEDTIGEILRNEDIRGMASGIAGKIISSPLLKIVAPIKLKTLLNLKVVHISDDMKELAEQYLQTIKK